MSENKKSGEMIFFAIPIQQVAWLNHNNRMYTQEAIEAEITRIGGNDVFGAIYPNTPKQFVEGLPEELGNNAETVSHSTTNLRIENGWMVGDIHIWNNEQGNILLKLMEKEPKPEFRICAILVNEDKGIVHEFQILSIDAIVKGA